MNRNDDDREERDDTDILRGEEVDRPNKEKTKTPKQFRPDTPSMN